MDRPDLIKQVKKTFGDQVEVAHGMGLTYWEIHRILLEMNLNLCFKADAEWWLTCTEKAR